MKYKVGDRVRIVDKRTGEPEKQPSAPNAVTPHEVLTCKSCGHYIGSGDFGLCCDLKYDLCYADTEVCEQFADAAGMVRCKDCIHCGFCGEATNLEVMGFYGYCSHGEHKGGNDGKM